MNAADKTSSPSIPSAAAALGGAGAVPFVVLALFSFPILPPYHFTAALHLEIYAAVILSFLGGIHWGLAMANTVEVRWPRLSASVVPALVAWAGLFISQGFGVGLIALGYIGQLLYDIAQTRSGNAPQWYPRLRAPLTLIVLVSLAISAFAKTVS